MAMERRQTFICYMQKIFHRIKMTMFSTLPKQLLKVLFFCILFSMLLSTFTIERLNDYFVNFISEKVDLTVNINSIVCSDEYISSVNFIKNRQSTMDYLERSMYYINTVKNIADNNDCDYYLTIDCDIINPNNNKEKLLNVSQDYFKNNPYVTIDSFEQFSCLAINESVFNKLRQDNEQYDQNNICILQEGAEIATLQEDETYQTKPIKIGDKIKLSYITGWAGASYADLKKISKEIEYTVVGFVNKDANITNDVSTMYIPLNNFLIIIQDVADQFSNDESLNMFKPYQANQSYLYCTSLQQFTTVMNQLKNAKSNGLYYSSNSSELAQMLSLTSAISSNINDFLTIITILTIMATIINALLTVFMRRKEIGLLSSLGESKNNISLQIIIEQVVLIFISAPLSLIMQKYISNKIITYMSTNNSLQIETLKMFFSQRILLQSTTKDYFALIILSIFIIIIYSLIITITVTKNDPKELLKG